MIKAASTPQVFEDPRLGVDGVAHGFFGRTGGFSTDIYSSLNCGPGSDDDAGHVRDNRARVAELIGVEAQNLLSLHQIHSQECVVVTEPWLDSQRPQADAMVTDQPGFGLGILTADCAPVLFGGSKADGSPVIGAAHAGWGGAFKGVLGNTVKTMVSIGVDVKTIRASIGPCIGQKSYEVGPEFIERFLDQDEGHERFFKASQKDKHMMFDLAGYVALRLAEAGITDVGIKDLDTYFNEEDFFSYRRSTHRHEVDYGRQISVIAIKA